MRAETIKTVSYTMPLWFAEKANLRKISYQSVIHKEPMVITGAALSVVAFATGVNDWMWKAMARI